MKKTKRVGFTWNQELVERRQDLISALKGLGEEGHDLSQKELFMICVVFALKNGLRGQTPKRKSDGPRLSYFDAIELEMLKAIAMKEESSLETILDEDHLYDFIEASASAGLQYLVAQHEEDGELKNLVLKVFYESASEMESAGTGKNE